MRGEAFYKGGLTRSPAGGATGPPVARGMGDRPPGPVGWAALLVGWATGACRPLGGRQAHSLFFSPGTSLQI